MPELSTFQPLKPYESFLHALGYSTVEQFVSVAQVSARELAAYLDIPINELQGLVNSANGVATTVPAASLNTILTASYPLGVSLDNIPRPKASYSFPLPVSPPLPTVNHIGQMPPIRNQANRGTCVAHAALAVYEHQLMMQGTPIDLSEQFLYWNCKANDGYPNSEGTWLAIAFPALSQDGCCLESSWVYVPTIIVGNEGHGPPPGGTQLEALTYRTMSTKQIAPTSVTDIKSVLASGQCVAFSIPVFNSWYRNIDVAHTGNIVMPLPTEVRVGGHAMCMVGYVDEPNTPGIGGGRFIIRNSWDSAWGIASAYGPGYGTIPFAFIDRYGVEAYSL